MDVVNAWVEARWQDTLVPLAVFIATFAVLQVLYRPFGRRLLGWVKAQGWHGTEPLLSSLRLAYLIWILLIAAYFGLLASQASPAWKATGGRLLWTTFVLSTAALFIRGVGSLQSFRVGTVQVPAGAVRQIGNGLSVIALLVAVLMVLDLWGAPVAPLLVLLAIGAVVAGIALRDVFPSLMAFFQLNTVGAIKSGDYVRLDTGEAGYVERVSWNAVQIRGLDHSLVAVPNAKMLKTTVVNYGRPLKQAREPFRFKSRMYLKEATGLKAWDLVELLAGLKSVPDSVIYYHTHHFMEEHQYMAPEPPNDFSEWVREVLDEEALGEKLASVDTFEFHTLAALRERLAGIVGEHLARGNGHRRAFEGREFHFIKSVGFVIPTRYQAHDLRELAEAFRTMPLSSLYFHIFESPLRMGRATNDFTVWLAESLGEEELAREVAGLDPYNYTLEEVRWLLVQAIERRIG